MPSQASRRLVPILSSFVAAAPVPAAVASSGCAARRPLHCFTRQARPSRGIFPMASEVTDLPEAPGTVRRIRIYTRTGDKGTTSLYTGERRAKDDVIFEALGSVDELTSTLGLALEHCEAGGESLADLAKKLEEIQSRLQDLNSNIATPRNSEKVTPDRLVKTEFDSDGKLSLELESWIDKYDDELPPLRQFILPSGGVTASTIHIARTICRRAERRVVTLVEAGIASPGCQKYLNRLSDFLFCAARYAGMKAGKKDRIYVKRDLPSS
ncbi:cob(I)yrinic acid a,c-diamide adenosyltransferase, mitochondrial-like protein [Hyaloraphidium curvatum]|nr:cob(I)yrinic acid a,c-diamide adenosyltransferase, mitochondrial-like protein [Hyaloraphidium curvatum]